MTKLFVLTLATLAIVSVSFNAHAGSYALDANGNLFVADASSGMIFKYTPDGKQSAFASVLKPDGGYEVACDHAGNVFVFDHDNHSIFKFNPDGKKTTFATGVKPQGMVFDKADNLFVPDYKKHSIFKFTPEGKKSTFASNLSPGVIAFDSAGNLFVVDLDRKAIFKFTPEGKKSTFASGVSPLELVVDASGNLFVPDYSNSDGHVILKFRSDGTRSTFASLGSDGIYDLAVDGATNLFVVNSDSKAIFKFAPDGTKSTFATGCFTGPVFDKSGNLFVTENVSDRAPIFKFTSDGTIRTFAATDRVSPDKKWEYVGENKPKIVEAGTNKVALDLSDQPGGNDFRSATIIWAPDSKRFAFNYGQQLKQATSLYQLNGDEWKALGSPDDNVSEVVHQAIAAQLKEKGLSEEKLSRQKKSLRSIWWTPKVTNWEDSNTAHLYASLRQVIALGDNPEMGDGFSANLLFTIKFDDAGNWKIMKMHPMSQENGDQGAKRE
jgi:sugar lactone lactonase YvrE